MSYRVTLMPAAERQLRNIYLWLTERSPAGANAWFNQFVAALTSLEEKPLSYGVAPEDTTTERQIRQLLFRTRKGRRYRVLFTIDRDDVIVLQIRAPGQEFVLGEDFEM